MTFRSRDTTLLPMPIIIATVLTLLLTVAAPAADACQPAAIPTSADNAPVGGRVLDLDTGEPVAGAVVILVAKRRPGSSLTEEPPRATTGSDGRYAFSAVPPNEYTLTARHPEYAVSQVAWLNDPRERSREQLKTGIARVDFRLQRAGTIGGRLTDTLGRPVAGATMIAVPVDTPHIPSYSPFGPKTDQNGQYVIPSLPKGRYQVLAEWIDPAAEGVSVQVAYQRTYFPGEQNRAGAALVSVEPGKPQTNIDFTLAPSDLLSITGRVKRAAAAGALEGYVLWGTSSIRAVKFDDDGRFSVRFLQPGRYTLVARVVEGERVRAASTSIDLSSNVTDIGLALQPTTTLAGRVVTADGGPLPESLQIAAVLSAGGSPVDPLTRDRSEVAADGAFAIHGVFGERVLRIVGVDREWMIERVTRAGKPVSAVRIQPSADIADLVVVIARTR